MLNIPSQIKIIEPIKFEPFKPFFEHYTSEIVETQMTVQYEPITPTAATCCPICEYFKSLDKGNENMAATTVTGRGSSPLYSKIVEKMGGDPPETMTERECIKELSSLSDREFLCGAYWMFNQIFNKKKANMALNDILQELSQAATREDMVKVLKSHGL